MKLPMNGSQIEAIQYELGEVDSQHDLPLKIYELPVDPSSDLIGPALDNWVLQKEFNAHVENWQNGAEMPLHNQPGWVTPNIKPTRQPRMPHTPKINRFMYFDAAQDHAWTDYPFEVVRYTAIGCRASLSERLKIQTSDNVVVSMSGTRTESGMANELRAMFADEYAMQAGRSTFTETTITFQNDQPAAASMEVRAPGGIDDHAMYAESLLKHLLYVKADSIGVDIVKARMQAES